METHLGWPAPTAAGPLDAQLRLPGSKSMTARALVLGAVSHGSTTLRGPLRARDTELMAAGLRAMGCHVSTADDNLWLLRPRPLTGPAKVNVGLAGTVLRFLPPVAGLATGEVAFDGQPAARHRAMAPMIGALRSLGARIDTDDGLPFTVHGRGRLGGGPVTIDASASSQLVSGLLLSAAGYDRGVVVRHVGAPVPKPRLALTVQMLRAAGAGVDDSRPDVWAVEPGRLKGRGWAIEPDLATAAPFLAAALVAGGTVTVQGWPVATGEPTRRLLEVLRQLGGEAAVTPRGLVVRGAGTVRGITADLTGLTDVTAVVAAVAALADAPSRLRGPEPPDQLARLALALSEVGADVTLEGSVLHIRPRVLRGGTLRTHGDRRLAHAGAVLGLAVPGLRLDDVACTAKTLPDFPRLWSTMVSSYEGGPAGTETRVRRG
ncbi:3-phosphoshikimate 1-carboxyvinyltransferase [Dactylosporangium sp. NPDC051541]|uniref:3-phosphoshikimate 1-carboxyvinyltransferase n=1 Tax=Dactylosporangium sp. NPDC051541 TaxID=3363977 RepID=UPI0037BB0ACA